VHADALTSPRWHRVSELIAARTGLHFPPERRADLQRALDHAAPEFGFDNCDNCVDWLLTTPLSTEEVRRLATHLTVGETYFFRERPSFNALATHVLPRLIQRRTGDRQLRLWSAACSSGEEAYSLAILLQQILPDWRDWDVSILATDINPQSLHKAEIGIYGEWSFRECAPEFREKYFSPAGDRRFRVRTELREMVTFFELNLAQDAFPAVHLGSMDLILCRNLLIYFTPEHARRLVSNLHRALMDEGWLIVSPAECSQSLFEGFTPVNFPGSVLYRKGSVAKATSSEPRRAVLSELEVSEVLAPGPAIPLPESLAAAETRPAPGQREIARLRARARELANQGELVDALEASERWIAADKLDAAAHYFVAMVLQELGERARARAALHRAVYLLPEFTLAHFALGNHARAEARHSEARRHFANAERLLRGRPADEPVPESDGLTAGRLREIIDALVADA
jgi:chemotaxis protein methyltransferase CheR